MELKLEQVSVHSRDIACRYVVVKAGETLSYSIKPHRNSIFFGIYRQAGNRKNDTITSRNSQRSLSSAPASMTSEERLRHAQLESVSERQKLEAGKVFKGSLAIEQEGMYVLVFDNTFSKQKSKLVTFILQVYPTSSEAPSKPEGLVDDEDSIPQEQEQVLAGVLQKRRRKRMQGWARRWFVLDFDSNTLNYYLNESSTVLRGAIPLKVAVYSANAEGFEINIDSGAEVWQLRAHSEGSFAMWKNALAHARNSTAEGRTHLGYGPTQRQLPSAVPTRNAPQNIVEQNLWNRLRDVLNDLTKVKNNLHEAILTELALSSDVSLERKRQHSPTRSKMPESAKVENSPRKNFWTKQRPSELAQLTPSTEALFADVRANAARQNSLSGLETQMNSALEAFENVLKEQALTVSGPMAAHILVQEDNRRSSMESVMSRDEVWSDALSGLEETGFLVVQPEPETSAFVDNVDDAASSDDEVGPIPEHHKFDDAAYSKSAVLSTLEEFSSDLRPLPTTSEPKLVRRITIPAILDAPPSALKLMTAKVGNDVSSMSAPAASNEPLTLLQKAAEELEYSELLDQACLAPNEGGSRILLVAAFAVSSFSSLRHKERNRRKPFNPLLAETFELVREDKQFRFVAEKVQHRPLVGIASSAESKNWTFQQYQATSQKFYGKSMLLTTEGQTSVKLCTGEVYIWEKPEVYLKNITWGDKFTEPYGEMVIRDIVSGETAVVKFVPSKGWGSSRSEELTIDAYNSKKEKYEKFIYGTWTQNLSMDSRVIWKVNPLVDDPANHCGFTTFAAQLNEITEVEKNHLPLTDSRLRPDLRHRENGQLGIAEVEKLRLEEGQRRRRAESESLGKPQEPRFFRRSAEGQPWTLKTGQEGYWSCRERNFEDAGVIDIFGLKEKH